MAKVIRVYSDNQRELVKSEEGYWFIRVKYYNRFQHQYQWSKWIIIDDTLESVSYQKVSYFDRSGVREMTDYNYIFNFSKEQIIIKYQGLSSRTENKYRVPDIKKWRI